MVRTYIPVEIARRVRAAARDRCGYCHAPERLLLEGLQFEHLNPVAAGGLTVETNLWLSCSVCNSHKGSKRRAVDPETGEEQPLFNPRSQVWVEHFRWIDGGLRVEGLTPTGRATVAALQLDRDEQAILVRGNWILAGWHPPED